MHFIFLTASNSSQRIDPGPTFRIDLFTPLTGRRVHATTAAAEAVAASCSDAATLRAAAQMLSFKRVRETTARAYPAASKRAA